MMQMYDFCKSILREIAPFLMLPVALSVLSIVFKIVEGTVSGCYVRDLEEELTKRKRDLEEELTKSNKEREEEKINIDKDLQKYFNYKE